MNFLKKLQMRIIYWWFELDLTQSEYSITSIKKVKIVSANGVGILFHLYDNFMNFYDKC